MLRYVHEAAPGLSVFFIKVPPQPPDKLTNDNSPDKLNNYSNGHFDNTSDFTISQDSGLDTSNDLDRRYEPACNGPESPCLNVFQQLVQLGFLSILPAQSHQSDLSNLSTDSSNDSYCCDSELVENWDNFSNILLFTRQILQQYLLQTISLLNLVHTRCLQMFIMCAFDMARDMQITPKKLEFAKLKEIELYTTLMEIAIKKQDEIRQIIDVTIENMRDELLDKAAGYEFIGKKKSANILQG